MAVFYLLPSTHEHLFLMRSRAQALASTPAAYQQLVLSSCEILAVFWRSSGAILKVIHMLPPSLAGGEGAAALRKLSQQVTLFALTRYVQGLEAHVPFRKTALPASGDQTSPFPPL